MYLLFDIGGTKMRLAVAKDLEARLPSGSLASDTVRIVATPGSVSELVAVFRTTTASLLGGKMPTAICGGITRKYEGAKPEIAKLFACPSFIENDTALAGLGEVNSGAGKGFQLVVYITISTGVGGVRLVNGEIDRSAQGFEPGYQFINVRGTPETLEQAVGGQALQARLGKSPKEVSDPVVWEELARLLAYGLHNIIVHWSPEALVLGGSMILGTPGINFDRVQHYLQQISTIFPTRPVLKRAELGDFGGLHGALRFLRQKLSN